MNKKDENYFFLLMTKFSSKATEQSPLVIPIILLELLPFDCYMYCQMRIDVQETIVSEEKNQVEE